MHKRCQSSTNYAYYVTASGVLYADYNPVLRLCTFLCIGYLYTPGVEDVKIQTNFTMILTFWI